MSFLTRTPALDNHVSIRLNMRAKAISDDVTRDNKRLDPPDRYKDIDGPPMRKLADMFINHEDTETISKWLNKQDTAFRDYVPRMVFEILDDNTYE